VSVPALARAVPAPTPPVSLPSAVRAAKSSSLPEQVSSLDRARVALNSGDPGAALAEIARYRSAWPRGVFLTEASVLEIEALAKRGEVALASRRAQAFVTAHPDSPQVERVR
jgi:outer membrane protein assembly factor BamD (BamD/ComL family)